MRCNLLNFDNNFRFIQFILYLKHVQNLSSIGYVLTKLLAFNYYMYLAHIVLFSPNELYDVPLLRNLNVIVMRMD